jgi:hypothetical protein
MKEGEKAIRDRQEREEKEAETFARRLKNSEGQDPKYNVSIIK